MPARIIEFDAASLVKLLTHYTEGQVPLNSEIKNMAVSQMVSRWVALMIESPDWTHDPMDNSGFNYTQPLFIKYMGKRIQTIHNTARPGEWGLEGAIEAPKRQ